MPQFTINPPTVVSPGVSFTSSTAMQINSIENIHALEFNFNVNDTINANTEISILEAYASTGFTPEVVVNYTEI
jgi:hypothetical protein